MLREVQLPTVYLPMLIYSKVMESAYAMASATENYGYPGPMRKTFLLMLILLIPIAYPVLNLSVLRQDCILVSAIPNLAW